MRGARITVTVLCLAAAVRSAAVARVPADQLATSTEPSSASVAGVSVPNEAEPRAIAVAASSRQRHRVRPLQESRAMQWVGVGTPPTLWHVPKPPVTPAWRFQPGVSSGSSFWPNIMHAMGGHPEQTASDKPAAKAATATATATAKAAASTTNATRQAYARTAAGTADTKISHLNALTSNTYQSGAAPAGSAGAGSAWTATQVSRPAAASARLATDTATSGMETVTQGPAVVTSTEATARRGQHAAGWIRVFSTQPQSEPVGTRTARRHDDPDTATARSDLSGAQTRRQFAGEPQGHPSQQYRAEYVTEPLGSDVLIAGPPPFPAHEVQTAPPPPFRPGRRQPPRRGFVDNMLNRLFGGSSPRPQRQRPSFTRQPAPHHQPTPQQQQQDSFQPQQQHGNLQQQSFQQQDGLQQQNNFQQQATGFQQASNVQQQNTFQQQVKPHQQLQNGFQQQQQFGQQQLAQQQFTGQFTQNDQFTPSVQDYGTPAGPGQVSHFRPLQVSPSKGQQSHQQQPRQQQKQQQQQPDTHSRFNVASQFVGSVHSVPVPAAARPAPSRPTKSRPGVPIFYEPAPAPTAAAAVDFEPARLPPARQSLDDGAASRAAALTAAYLRSPQKTERRDDGTMVVTGALLDDTASDDVVELVIEYDNDLESIVDDLLREVRGGRAAAEREPAPAASQLRRRPLIVQQLDQRLGLAHQPYYHVAMALHSLTQGASRR